MRDDNLIAGREPLESAWRRATDQCKALLSTIRMRVAGPIIGLAAVCATLFLIPPSLTGNIYIRSTLSVAAFIFFLPLIYISIVIHVLVSQRNEARDELLQRWDRQKPKLTVEKNPQIQRDLLGIIYPSSIPASFRVIVQNESEAIAENCTANLLEVKPLVNWLPFVEGSKTWQNDVGFPEMSPPAPLPAPLSWSDNRSVVDIPPLGGTLLDVCFYCPNEYGPDYLAIGFASEDMRKNNPFWVMDIVLSISIQSKNCLPVYCVCKYMPDELIGEVAYLGPDRPNVGEYRICKKTPRPPEWGLIDESNDT